ncbi:hypothetical protein FRC17_000467 [Serendipita sp. 399]|nr:hypothetical protein FRC17_000467 [Serendipita sp. 399]
MTLKTGQALLFSPASLFVSNKGTLATLSTGYAIIKSRPRLTEDGGGSLLATTGKCAEDVSEKILVAPITPHSSRPTSPSDNSNAKASPDFNQTAFSPPRSLDTHTGMAASVDDLPQQSFSSRLSLSGTSLPRSSARTSDADPIVTQAPLPVVTPPAEFSLLIQVLEEMELETGVSFQPNLDVRQRIVTKNPDAICQGENKNWRTYLKFAKSYQIVEVMDSGSHKKIALTPRYRAMPRSSGHLDCQHVPSTSSSDQSHSSSANVPEQFRGLVSVMAALSSNGTPGLTQTAIGAKLLKDLSTHYRVYGYRKLKDFLKAASDAGLVEVVSSVIGGESTWKLTTP